MKFQVCPICHRRYNTPPAISRKDNKTKICPECSANEALIEFIKYNNNPKN